MADDAIKTYAHALANALPDRPPAARRRRERFVVERAWAEGSRYIGLEVCVDDGSFLATHTTPGQYVTFQYGVLDPHFVVIANAPLAPGDDGADARWEFLIDRQSTLGATLDGIGAGSRVLLSPAEGSGYPAEAADGGSALVFTTGAGIAAVRPLVQSWQRPSGPAAKQVALYYGESERAEFAYLDDLSRWRAGGVRVFEAVENLGGPDEGYRYVQHAFEADAPNLDDAAIFVSGSPIMMELIIEKLLRLGVARGHIHINV